MVKIRTGFVSNSSSSSFIVQCKKSDNTINAIEEFNIAFEDNVMDDEDCKEIYDEHLNLAKEAWDRGEAVLFESIDRNAVDELEDIFQKMGLKCIMGEE
jgi:ArsR family metal-binding transcriptional regulator